jgi:hypothetical protein
VVEALNLRPSVQLVYEIEPDGRVLLSAKTGTFASVAAELTRKRKGGPVRTLEEMDAAVRMAAGRRYVRP